MMREPADPQLHSPDPPGMQNPGAGAAGAPEDSWGHKDTAGLGDTPGHGDTSGGGVERTVLYPGVGADPRLFTFMRSELPGLVTPPLPTLQRGGDLPTAAGRAWEELLADERFAGDRAPSPERPIVVGGISFGGMIGLEMAILHPQWVRCVIMIASCRAADAVPRKFQFQERLGRLVPAGMMRKFLVNVAGVFIKRDQLDAESGRLLVAMSEEADITQLRRGSRTISGWRRKRNELPRVPIFQLHGDRDWVIPARDGDPDELVEGAGHMVSFTHPDVVVRYVRKALAGRR